MLGRLRGDRGEVTVVKVAFGLFVVAVLYFGWVYGGVYTDQFIGVRQAVRRACNIAYQNRAEQPVKDQLYKSIKELNMEDSHIGEDGQITKSQVTFDDDNIDTINITQNPPEITLELHYTRTVVLPFLKKEKTVEFTQKHTEDLATIKY